MTIRQIADAAGCHIDTVRKVARPLFPGVKSNGRGLAIEYNKEQCISIMEKLPKRNNVDVKNEVNANIVNPLKKQVAPLDNSSSVMLQMFQGMMEQNRIQQEQNQLFMKSVLLEIKNISNPKLQIEQPRQDYYSLTAYCNLKSIKVSHSEAIMHGKALKRSCDDHHQELRQIPDERWGKVNSYPIEILEEYFTV